MALPSTPPISMLQVYAEFGAPVGTPLAAFVRGGVYVPDIPVNAGVPAAPPISLLHLLGAAATSGLSVVASPNPSVYGTTLPHSGSPATLEVSTSTTVNVTGGSGSFSYAWEFLSGAGHSISFGGSPVGKTATFSAVHARNTELTSFWRCTATGPSGSGSVDVQVTTSYSTDL
jgi:hypothetical protein